jgi:hypothetical protein
MMDTPEQIKKHNEIAARIDAMDKLRPKVATGLILFWVLWAVTVGLVLWHYVPIWFDQLKGLFF